MALSTAAALARVMEDPLLHPAHLTARESAMRAAAAAGLVIG